MKHLNINCISPGPIALLVAFLSPNVLAATDCAILGSGFPSISATDCCENNTKNVKILCDTNGRVTEL